MRSQKQVRRAGKVRSLKNTAAGKWRTYRRQLEARKAWQNNSILMEHQHSCYVLTPPPPKHRRFKEPKQRSPEELAARQRLREQRRLEKKLAEQRASTSTLPEIKKEKQLEEVLSNDPPKKASAEPKITTKTTKAENSITEIAKHTMNMAQRERAAKKVKELEAIKVPALKNGSKSKYQNLKEEKPMYAEKEKNSQSSSPIKPKQKELVQLKKTTNEDEQSEVHANTGICEEISKEQKKRRNRRLDPDSLLSQYDFVEGNVYEIGCEEAKADFMGIVGRRKKNKEKHRSEQQSKLEGFIGKIKKREQDISEKKENKELNEAVTYLSKDQSCASESTGIKDKKIVDHGAFSSHEIPKDSETLSISKTELIMKASILEMEMKVARLAQEHPGPLYAKNLSLSDNITGNMATTTCPKEAKCVVDIEKKEPPVALVSETDEVGHSVPTREHICKLLPRDIQFCVHMIEKYGENYEAMAKDQGNIFRDSSKGIARKIRIFKESPQYETYLRQKAEKDDSLA